MAIIEDLLKSGGAKVFAGDPAPETLTNDALRLRSMWITSGDESGLELRLRGSDGGFYGVEGPDGKPITRSWADLLTRAGAAKKVDDTGEGTSEWMRRYQQDANPQRANPHMSKEQRDKMYGIKR